MRSRTYHVGSIALLFVLSGAATRVVALAPPAPGGIEIRESAARTDWTIGEILTALRQVETGGAADDGRHAVGDGGRAIGPLQIHRAYWQDAGLPGSFEDCRDPDYARAVVLAYWRRYCPRALSDRDAEVLVRIHNGGPKGDRKSSTDGFWRKVEGALLEAQRFSAGQKPDRLR